VEGERKANLKQKQQHYDSADARIGFSAELVPISPTTTAIISPPRLLLLHLLSASLSDRVPFCAVLLLTDIEINGATVNKMKSYNAVSEMI
jgi:hypothetical protein